MSEIDAAKTCLRNGDPEGMERICQELVENDPDNAQAWQLLGVAHAELGNPDEAVSCLERATSLDTASSLYPYNLALAHRAAGNIDLAVANYRLAIERDPDFLEAQSNLGTLMLERGQFDEAVACFRDLVERFPESNESRVCLANSLTDSGKIEEAREVWRDWLARDPGNGYVQHMLAASSDESEPPARCTDDFIRGEFDKTYANNFEQRLRTLEYSSPELIGEALASLDPQPTDLQTLDIGCGTGLCGPMLRPMSDRLVGVDLSAAMLEQAERRGDYDQITEGEITQFMQARTDTYDLVVSADTFCYFGELEEVLDACRGTLRNNGWLVFTVESPAPESLTPEQANLPLRLQSHGRYCHSEKYVRDAVQRAGFEIVWFERAVQRREKGRPVEGLIVMGNLKS